MFSLKTWKSKYCSPLHRRRHLGPSIWRPDKDELENLPHLSKSKRSATKRLRMSSCQLSICREEKEVYLACQTLWMQCTVDNKGEFLHVRLHMSYWLSSSATWAFCLPFIMKLLSWHFVVKLLYWSFFRDTVVANLLSWNFFRGTIIGYKDIVSTVLSYFSSQLHPIVLLSLFLDDFFWR